MSAIAAPIVGTFLLDADAQRWFDELRRREFPPERNHLAAHLTAFHAVPAAHLDLVRARVADGPGAPLPMTVTGVRLLGRGVAFGLEGAEVSAVRTRLLSGLDELTAQDRQPWRPHITVQNKVTPDRAKALHRQLQTGFEPFVVTVEGVALWRYLGGLWEPLDRVHWRV